jgi:hypothetical protein
MFFPLQFITTFYLPKSEQRRRNMLKRKKSKITIFAYKKGIQNIMKEKATC